MNGSNERRALRAEIRKRFGDGDLAATAARVEEIHIEHHDNARIHMQVHRWRLRIALRQGRWFQALLEVLAVPVAAPVSWVQRYWGLALASRMNRPPR